MWKAWIWAPEGIFPISPGKYLFSAHIYNETDTNDTPKLNVNVKGLECFAYIFFASEENE